jgi:hypothetical protein
VDGLGRYNAVDLTGTSALRVSARHDTGYARGFRFRLRLSHKAV